MVTLASRIKGCVAGWAVVSARHVFMDGHLSPAASAKNCFLFPLGSWPDHDRMIRQRRVAIFTGIVEAAALHLDRDNVSGSMIMFAAGLGVDVDAAYVTEAGEVCLRIHECQPIVNSSS